MKDQPMPEALLEVTHQEPLVEDFKPHKNFLLYNSYKRGIDAKKQEKYSLEESEVTSTTYLSDDRMDEVEEINFCIVIIGKIWTFPTKNR